MLVTKELLVIALVAEVHTDVLGLHQQSGQITAHPLHPAGQVVGIREEDNEIWLVSFMDFDLGFFDQEEVGLNRHLILSNRTKC